MIEALKAQVRAFIQKSGVPPKTAEILVEDMVSEAKEQVARDLNSGAIKWLTIYEITRHYGGPEEGGWWYNLLDLLETLPISVSGEGEIETLKLHLLNKHKELVWGDIYSVNGGAELEIILEDSPGENRTEKTPTYE